MITRQYLNDNKICVIHFIDENQTYPRIAMMIKYPDDYSFNPSDFLSYINTDYILKPSALHRYFNVLLINDYVKQSPFYKKVNRWAVVQGIAKKISDFGFTCQSMTDFIWFSDNVLTQLKMHV